MIDMNDPRNICYTVIEVCRILGKDESTMWDKINAGAIVIGRTPGGRPRVLHTEVERYAGRKLPVMIDTSQRPDQWMKNRKVQE